MHCIQWVFSKRSLWGRLATARSYTILDTKQIECIYMCASVVVCSPSGFDLILDYFGHEENPCIYMVHDAVQVCDQLCAAVS